MEDKKKILIVEDEAINAMYLGVLLKNNGFESTGTAATGESAIASVEKDCPDLILMDITLRNSMDGISVATILRKKYIFPIIFISGYDDKETLARIHSITNTWKLSKPIVETTLIDLICEVLAH
ncbi:MAG: CheY-like chemotaxis protein [Cyclobacteriaceae bacterium]|jgi:CheY-like chemotaxis protein